MKLEINRVSPYYKNTSGKYYVKYSGVYDWELLTQDQYDAHYEWLKEEGHQSEIDGYEPYDSLALAKRKLRLRFNDELREIKSALQDLRSIKG